MKTPTTHSPATPPSWSVIVLFCSNTFDDYDDDDKRLYDECLQNNTNLNFYFETWFCFWFVSHLGFYKMLLIEKFECSWSSSWWGLSCILMDEVWMDSCRVVPTRTLYPPLDSKNWITFAQFKLVNLWWTVHRGRVVGLRGSINVLLLQVMNV